MFQTIAKHRIRYHNIILRLRPTVARYSIPYFSTVAATEVESDLKEVHLAYTFQSHFNFNTASLSDLSIPEGGYIDISKDDLEKYLPEGLAGEGNEEMQFATANKWMVREAGKLLCTIVDKYPKKSINNSVTDATTTTTVNNTPKLRFRIPIDIPGLTNRPEWDSAKLKIQHFGKDLSAINSQETSVAVNTPNISPIETYCDQLLAPGMPQKFLLSGIISNTFFSK